MNSSLLSHKTISTDRGYALLLLIKLNFHKRITNIYLFNYHKNGN